MDKKLLGLRIKELRKAKGFTQEELAEKLNIETRQLSKLETGKHYPSFETVVALLKTFDMTFEELTTFDHLDTVENIKQKLQNEIDSLDENKTLMIYKLIRNLTL